VSLIVCASLCAAFYLNLVQYFVLHVYYCELCLIVVLLSAGKTPFAVPLKL
jgi:cation transport ATPase